MVTRGKAIIRDDGSERVTDEPCAVCGKRIGRVGPDGVLFMDGKWRHHGCGQKQDRQGNLL